MIEQIRQFVVFGNFNSINFENINLLEAIIKKYDLYVSAGFDPTNSFTIPWSTPKLCPILKSKKNRNITILLGSERLHVQENNVPMESYKDFNEFSLSVINSIINTFNPTINRLAINGQFLFENSDEINKTFKAHLSKSIYATENPNEWSFRFNNIIEVDKINTKINTIVSFIKTNVQKQQMIMAYDYNTVMNIKNNFSTSQISLFNELGIKFRKDALDKKW